jgi:hypothetical protein
MLFVQCSVFFIFNLTEPSWASSTIIAVIVSSVILIIVLTVITVWFIARSRITKIPDNFLSVTVNPDYMPDYDGEYTNSILHKSRFILIHVFFVYSVIMMVSTPTLYYTKANLF